MNRRHERRVHCNRLPGGHPCGIGTQRTNHTTHSAQHGGSALIVVLVVIVLLSLGAYIYSDTNITELQATRMHGLQIATRSWAESGVEYVAAVLGPTALGGTDVDLYDNPGLFMHPLGNGGFSILSPIEDDVYLGAGSQVTGSAVRFGLIDECAKLNVNVLALFQPESLQGRMSLMAIPGMTEQAADGILDWIDADDQPREFGAEFDSYISVVPRNGPLKGIEELLLVWGVTPELLYGEDANRNGLLDPSENDGEASLPFDNADGLLDLGWSEYLTVYSQETNVRRSPDYYGEPKIYINNSILTELYDTVEEQFGPDAAQFIVALRLYGPASQSQSEESSGSTNNVSGSQAAQASSVASASTGEIPQAQTPISVSSSGTSPSTTGDAATDDALENAASGIAGALLSGSGGSVTRGGMDLSQGAKYELKSLYDLVDAEVQGEIEGVNSTLSSPWTSNPSDLAENWPLIMDAFSITESTTIQGRININQARYEVLASIPNVPEGLPQAIIATRANAGESRGTSLDIYGTTGWLLIEGLVDVPTMRQLDPFITTRGDVFRFQVVAHADEGGPVARVEAVIDATQPIPTVVYRRDLAPLGPGFHKDQLPVFTAP